MAIWFSGIIGDYKNNIKMLQMIFKENIDIRTVSQN